jgi:ornithine--oxo-acid transaminase
VRGVRGLGLMWAMEFGEPDSGSVAWRLMERMQAGLFAQLVVVPLFTKHHILSQVAGHDLPVLKGLPPLVVTDQDLEEFVSALDDVIAKAGRPTRVAGLALRAARAR